MILSYQSGSNPRKADYLSRIHVLEEDTEEPLHIFAVEYITALIFWKMLILSDYINPSSPQWLSVLVYSRDHWAKLCKKLKPRRGLTPLGAKRALVSWCTSFLVYQVLCYFVCFDHTLHIWLLPCFWFLHCFWILDFVSPLWTAYTCKTSFNKLQTVTESSSGQFLQAHFTHIFTCIYFTCTLGGKMHFWWFKLIAS